MSFRADSSTEGLTRTSSLPTSTAYTIAGWFQKRGTGDGTWEHIFGLLSSGGSNWNILYKRITGSDFVRIHGASGDASLGVTLSNDTWYYVAIGSNGTGSSALTGWVITTGNTVYTASTFGTSFTAAEMSLLKSSAYGEWVNGKVANVIVWSTKLTTAELQQQMWSIVPVVQQANVHLFTPLWTPNHLNDLSGNGRTWSSMGGTPSTEDHPPVSWSLPVSWTVAPASGGGPTSLIVQDATHTHAADAITLTSNSDLAVTDATHTHATDAIALTVAAVLAVNDATHEHAADAITLGVGIGLTVQDAAHAHTTDTITLISNSDLAITDATHAHAADTIALTVAAVLAVDDATHEHTADAITLSLTGSETLTVQDATHTHAADAITLTSHSALVVADATHEHVTDPITLTAAGNVTLTVQDATHLHATDGITITSASYLAMADAAHNHTADGITLALGFGLTIADATHEHASDGITLISASYLAVSDATHTHTVDSIILNAEGDVYFGMALLSNSLVEAATLSDSRVDAAVLGNVLYDDADMEFEP